MIHAKNDRFRKAQQNPVLGMLLLAAILAGCVQQANSPVEPPMGSQTVSREGFTVKLSKDNYLSTQPWDGTECVGHVQAQKPGFPKGLGLASAYLTKFMAGSFPTWSYFSVPSSTPQVGDVLLWNEAWFGGSGHMAVVTAVTTTPKGVFVTVSQRHWLYAPPPGDPNTDNIVMVFNIKGTDKAETSIKGFVGVTTSFGGNCTVTVKLRLSRHRSCTAM